MNASRRAVPLVLFALLNALCAVAQAGFPVSNAQSFAGVQRQDEPDARPGELSLAMPLASGVQQGLPPVTQYSSSYYTPGSMLADLLSVLWVVNNIVVSFDTYPYAHGNYIVAGDFGARSTFSDTGEQPGDGEGAVPSSAAYSRNFRFAVDTAAFWVKGFGAGNESRFEGYLFKFIGPVFENALFTKDFTQIGVSGNDRGNLRLGGQIALMQTNMLSASFAVQWSHWYGSFRGDGVAVSLIARSYPVKPLLIEWRGIMHIIEKNGTEIDMFESHLEVGFMVWRRFELFAAWKYLSAGEGDYYFAGAAGNGISLGMRVHF